MKKYSKLIVMTVIMIATLIAFYIHLQSITDTFARFEIKTIEGDETLIEPFVVHGDTSSYYFNYEPFVLKNNETEYFREVSLTERLGNYYMSEKVKQLQKEYRNFMRGKTTNEASYGTTEEKVYYANFSYSNFSLVPDKIKVEMLDRKTKEKKQGIIDAPDLYTYAYVNKVIPNGNEVYIVIENIFSDDSFAEDTHRVEWQIYHYDFANNTSNDPIIIETGEMYAYNNFLTVLTDDDNSPTEIVLAASIIDYKYVDSEQYSETYETEQEFVNVIDLKRINLKTQEISELKIEDKSLGVPIAFNGEEIIYVNKGKNELKYMTFHIESKQTTERITVPFDAQFLSYWDFYNNAVTNDYVYTLYNSEASNDVMVIVLDTEKVEIAFMGKIENVNEASLKDLETTFYFNEIEIVD